MSDLFSWQPPKQTAFGGETYEPEKDHARLNQQLKDVYELMKDGRWRTINEICNELCHPQPSVSARLRDLRKEKFGGHTVDRERLKGGLYQYRVLVNKRNAA
jgi:hypothetical protein